MFRIDWQERGEHPRGRSIRQPGVAVSLATELAGQPRVAWVHINGPGVSQRWRRLVQGGPWVQG